MKTRNLFWSILLIGIVCFYTSCADKDEDTNVVPPPLKNISVENVPGGSVISYEAVTSEVILVTAKYPLEDGGIQILRFNIEDYPTSLRLNRLAPVKKTVELYTVNKYGNSSSIETVEIDPLLSLEREYMNGIIESTIVTAIPGGIEISYADNVAEKELTLNFSYKDEEGKWVDLPLPAITQESGVIVIDDFISSDFSLFFNDETDEISDTKAFTITPIIEELVDNSFWKHHMLPGDTPARVTSLPIERLWDNDITQRFETRADPFPQSFTIDLGATQDLILSKIRIFIHSTYTMYCYDAYHPKVIEVYGSNSPATDGSWGSWTKLGECVSTKPSGSPFGTVTTADFDYVKEGELYKLNSEEVTYRYIRFNVLETWSGDASHSIRMNQVILWGYN